MTIIYDGSVCFNGHVALEVGTVFPLISAPGTYLISELQGEALIEEQHFKRRRRLFESKTK